MNLSPFRSRSRILNLLLTSLLFTPGWQPMEASVLSLGRANTTLSGQEVESIVNESLRQGMLQEEGRVRDSVEEEVARSFGSTMKLIQFLLGVLAILPVLLGVAVFVLRSSIIRQIVDEATRIANAEVSSRISEVLADFQDSLQQKADAALAGFHGDLEQKAESYDADHKSLIEKYDIGLNSLMEKVRGQLQPTINSQLQAEDSSSVLCADSSSSESMPYNSEHKKAWLCSRQGVCAMRDMNYGSAIADFDNAIRLNASEYAFYLMKASALYEMRRHEEALAVAEDALCVNSQAAVIWQMKAILLMRLGRFKEALVACEKATAIDDMDFRSWDMKAWIYNNLDMRVEARKAAEKSKEIENL
ncbi:tetratricopeptide repeat protein [Cyanobium gracile]|uniref:Uncharacterized protein n=1 Tax=Cyanobium gracile (strain ATCC 27147 / PCC 6307) TaxID=292564 RepID=K9PAR5_CYAGP|nr:tetratricopeptide repeat protein [Cyanobium gracile]AFY30447.1 hypothetical protein Cyagr_3382 [Cyanobium gracile PCC 6307]